MAKTTRVAKRVRKTACRIPWSERAGLKTRALENPVTKAMMVPVTETIMKTARMMAPKNRPIKISLKMTEMNPLRFLGSPGMEGEMTGKRRMEVTMAKASLDRVLLKLSPMVGMSMKALPILEKMAKNTKTSVARS